MSAIEHQLVWYTSGNSDHIPGRKFLPGATLNGAIALLVRRDRFSVYQGAPTTSVAEPDCTKNTST